MANLPIDMPVKENGWKFQDLRREGFVQCRLATLRFACSQEMHKAASQSRGRLGVSMPVEQ